MSARKAQIAERCLKASETGTMTFPEIVGALIVAGFDGYTIDFRRGAATYHSPEGSIDLPMHKLEVSIAPHFDTATIQSAISEAQRLVPGYTYVGFCNKVAAAGCAGYMVSFLGRRALYFGRTAETHVEHFPD